MTQLDQAESLDLLGQRGPQRWHGPQDGRGQRHAEFEGIATDTEEGASDGAPEKLAMPITWSSGSSWVERGWTAAVAAGSISRSRVTSRRATPTTASTTIAPRSPGRRASRSSIVEFVHHAQRGAQPTGWRELGNGFPRDCVVTPQRLPAGEDDKRDAGVIVRARSPAANVERQEVGRARDARVVAADERLQACRRLGRRGEPARRADSRADRPRWRPGSGSSGARCAPP